MKSGERWLNISSAIATNLSFVASIVFQVSGNTSAALLMFSLSLLICVFLWLYYAKRRNTTTHPYEEEHIFNHYRYVFDSPTCMTYEVVSVFRVTKPIMTAFPVSLTWSGQGPVRNVVSDLFKQEIIPSFDGQTGEISFSLPFPEPKRFGDIATISYRIKLEDKSGLNIPQISLRAKIPHQLVVFEVQLKHITSCAPAKLSWSIIGDSSLVAPREIQQVPFDSLTKSFRTTLVAPCIGRSYKLEWKAN